MKATLTSKEGNVVKFQMEFTAEEFEQGQAKAYQSSKDKFVVDGFRKGKAPRRLVEAHYGEDVFFEDAINHMFNDSYPQALGELDVDVIDRPKTEFSEVKKGEGFTVDVTVEVYPVFDVKDYMGVKVKKIVSEVTDEDVDKEIEKMIARNSRMVLADRAAVKDDVVLIDYDGSVDGKPFEGGQAERYPLKLGSDTFIPGFEDQLLGVKAGDEVDVKVTFPTEYHAEELAGKDAVFKCKVHEIKELQKPELDDEFVKDVSECDTVDEYKKETRERLEKSAAAKDENEMRDAALKVVYDANEIIVPKVMVEDEIDGMMNEFDQQLRGQGLDLPTYLNYMQKDMEGFRADCTADAERKVKTRMIVSKIAEQENIEVSKEEIDKELEIYAMEYKQDVEKVRQTLGAQNLVFIAGNIKMRKAAELVYSNVVFEEA